MGFYLEIEEGDSVELLREYHKYMIVIIPKGTIGKVIGFRCYAVQVELKGYIFMFNRRNPELLRKVIR